MLPIPSPPSSSSPEEPKQEKPKPEPEAEAEAVYKLIPSLPDDVALSCLARVPRFQHGTLSLVSKPIRSFVSSPLFFNLRSRLRCTETLIYVTLLPWNHFILAPCQNHFVPLQLPPIPSPLPNVSLAVVGPSVYVIGGGGYARGALSAQVWVLDCRFNRWQPGPTMLVARMCPGACVVDGKIYVIGGCKESSIWAEVLDPVVGRWEQIMPPPGPAPSPARLWARTVAVDHKVCIFDDGEILVFDTRNKVWERSRSTESRFQFSWRISTASAMCVVDGVYYVYSSCGDRKIRGFDLRQGVGRGVWKELKGLPPGFDNGGKRLTMAGVAGKLLVFWACKTYVKEQQFEIWCHVIEVNRNQDAELWGNVRSTCKILSLWSPDFCWVWQCSALVL